MKTAKVRRINLATKQIFKEIPRNSLEKIVISESEWREASYLDIRIYYDASNGQGTGWRPTKKGLTIRHEDLADFKKAIDTAYEELVKL